MKMKLFSFCFLSFISFSFSQNIVDLKLNDGISYPLKRNDNGFKFEYFCLDRGRLQAFFSFESIHFSIFKNQIDYYGKTSFVVPTEKLKYFFETYRNPPNPFVLSLIHESSRNSKRSEQNLKLHYSINAPYGTRIKSLPEKPSDTYDIPTRPDTSQLRFPSYPSLYRTDFMKSQTNQAAVVGFWGGAAVTVGGLLWSNDLNKQEQKDDKKIKTANIVMIAGALVALLSSSSMYKTVEDVETNSLNRAKNDEIISGWRRDYENIKSSKNRIIEKWQHNVDEIKKTNTERLSDWQTRYNEAMQLNDLIIQTYTIKIRVTL